MTDKFHQSPPALTREEGDYRPNPMPHAPLAGDHRDDDGIALDQYFEAMPQGPQDYSGIVTPDHAPPVVGRTIHKRISLDAYPVGQAVLLYPADPRRKWLYMEGYSPDLILSANLVNAANATYADVPTNSLAPLSYNIRVSGAGTAGFLNLNIGDANGVISTWDFRPLNAPGTNTKGLISPMGNRIQVTVTGGVADGSGTYQIWVPRAVQRYAWASDGLTPNSMVELIGRTDFQDYTGPIYVCRTVAEPTTVSAWAVTS